MRTITIDAAELYGYDGTDNKFIRYRKTEHKLNSVDWKEAELEARQYLIGLLGFEKGSKVHIR